MDYKVSLFEVRNPLIAIPYSDMPIFATTNRLKDYNITYLSLGHFAYLMEIENWKRVFITPRIATHT